MPTGAEIEEFLSIEVAERILDRYLKGTDKYKLKKCGTMEKLLLFVIDLKYIMLSMTSKQLRNLIGLQWNAKSQAGQEKTLHQVSY